MASHKFVRIERGTRPTDGEKLMYLSVVKASRDTGVGSVTDLINYIMYGFVSDDWVKSVSVDVHIKRRAMP